MATKGTDGNRNAHGLMYAYALHKGMGKGGRVVQSWNVVPKGHDSTVWTWAHCPRWGQLRAKATGKGDRYAATEAIEMTSKYPLWIRDHVGHNKASGK
jgi:hypothetical protein